MQAIYADDRIKEYVLDLVVATRRPADVGLPDLAPLIEFGASPRAAIFLLRAAKAHAFLRGRAYVTPDDIKALGLDVLRHRVILTYRADAEGRGPGRGARPHPRGGAGAMTPEEVTREVRRIEITTRHLVRDIVAGEYSSAFRGRGVEFAEVREYQPGDDIRTIDWNVTARLGAAYVKRYLEERELTVLFVVDVSASGGFGSRRRTKGELGAEVAAVLALAAARNNDRVGALFFTDRIEHYLAPAKGRRHALRLISDLLAFEPRGTGTDLGARARPSWSRCSAAARSSSCSPISWRRATRRCSAGSRGGTTSSACSSPIRASGSCPTSGLVTLWDPETEAWRRVDTATAACGRTSLAGRRRSIAGSSGRCAERGADLLRLETGQPYAEPLLAFFRRRERMLWR